MLRSYVEQPLIDKEKIEERLDAIEELNQNALLREELREYLGPIYDLERLVGRISYKSANPRDLVAFRSSLKMLPYLRELLREFHSPLLMQIHERMDAMEELENLVSKAIVEEPPIGYERWWHYKRWIQ